MARQDIAASLQRVKSVFSRRPEAAVHDDAPGIVRWQGGLRFEATHQNGTRVWTDMPAEVGGTGDQVSPGWLARAGLAACTASCIALAAATEGIELETLEVKASSRSDARGMLGIATADRETVYPGPHDVQLHVRISARGVAPQRLRTLVEESNRRAPITAAFKTALEVSLHIEIDGA